MEEMLKEAQYCQKIIATKFKKPLTMSEKDEQHFKRAISAIFAASHIPIKISGSGITVISQVLTEDRLIKNVI